MKNLSFRGIRITGGWMRDRPTTGGAVKQGPGELAEQFYDAFNRGELEEALELFSEDCELYEPVRGEIRLDQFRRNLAGLKLAMPDSKMTIESTMIKGNTIAVEGSFGGSHTGTLVGSVAEFPATEKKLNLRFAAFMKVARGKIVSHRVYFNQLDVVSQLELLDLS
jgi:steroid delta-isomerase-like uncharacterized protein